MSLDLNKYKSGQIIPIDSPKVAEMVGDALKLQEALKQALFFLDDIGSRSGGTTASLKKAASDAAELVRKAL